MAAGGAAVAARGVEGALAAGVALRSFRLGVEGCRRPPPVWAPLWGAGAGRGRR